MSKGEGVTSEEAFAALGNELRISILHVLAEATEVGKGTVTFSDIYDQIDIDSTSQLSYHLDALTGIFVRNSDGGYALTQAGDRVVRSVRSGTYSERPSFEPTTIEGQCPDCDATVLSAEYRDPFLVVECESCSVRVVTYNLPPAEPVDRTNLETLRSCNRRVHQEYATALRGTCSTCGGAVELDIEQRDEPNTYTCVAECNRCRLRLFAPLEVRVLHHPAVISFYWQHGVDASTLPLWELASFVEDWEIEVVETDPLEFIVSVVHDGAMVQVAVDDELNVAVSGDETVTAD